MHQQSKDEDDLSVIRSMNNVLQDAQAQLQRSIHQLQIMGHNPISFYQNISQYINGTLSISNKIAAATSLVEKFDRKVFLRTCPANSSLQSLSVFPVRHQQIGIYENSIIQQIQQIDNHKKESYQSFNHLLSNRIYFVNKTMDNCTEYLKKNL